MSCAACSDDERLDLIIASKFSPSNFRIWSCDPSVTSRANIENCIKLFAVQENALIGRFKPEVTPQNQLELPLSFDSQKILIRVCF